MKIAMFFSGRISLHLHEEEYIKKLIKFIKQNDIKCFCAINDVFQISEDFIESFNIVNYKKYKFNANEHLADKYIKLLWNEYVMSTFYAHKLNFEMLKDYQEQHDIVFDIVWFTRDDLLFDYILPNKLEKNTLYVSNKKGEEVNSAWAYGDLSIMKKYSSLYDHVNKFIKHNKLKKYKNRFSYENILYVLCQEYNIGICKTHQQYALHGDRKKQ